MIATPFGNILRQVVQQTPGAVGGALAARDGELVDSWTTWDHGDWAILTAHFGIIVTQIRSALHTFHFGDVQFLFFDYQELEVLIQLVAQNYFAILAVTPPVHLPMATQSLKDAAHRMHMEMI